MLQQRIVLSLSEERRLVAGLLVQPFLATAVAFVIFPFVLLDQTGQTLAGGFPADSTDAAISVALGIGGVATLITFLGAMPTAIWLTSRRRLSLRDALLSGLTFSCAPYLLMAVAAGGTYGLEGLLRGVLFSSAIGLTGAIAFWTIALRSRQTGHPSHR